MRSKNIWKSASLLHGLRAGRKRKYYSSAQDFPCSISVEKVEGKCRKFCGQ